MDVRLWGGDIKLYEVRSWPPTHRVGRSNESAVTR